MELKLTINFKKLKMSVKNTFIIFESEKFPFYEHQKI